MMLCNHNDIFHPGIFGMGYKFVGIKLRQLEFTRPLSPNGCGIGPIANIREFALFTYTPAKVLILVC
jgi:hypothetical protein